MRPILLHIGYHKTGTTWMQRRLFQRDCGYLPMMDHDDVFETITKPHRLGFDPSQAQNWISEGTKKGSENLVPMISSEILSGHPFWGGRDSVDFAHRLKEIAPNARVLITIREQIKIIASVYMQYVRRAGKLSPKDFFAENPVLGYDVFDPLHFEYDRLLALYQDLFGADNVKVMTQEQLARDPSGFVRDLAAFSGADPDATPSTEREGASEKEASVWALRRINNFTYDGAGTDPIFNLGPVSNILYRGVGWAYRQPFATPLGAKNKPVTQVVQDRFGGRFAASNQRLQKLAGDSLNLSGYEI